MKGKISKLLRDARKRAKKKGIPFDLKKEDVEIPKKCPILEIDLFFGNKNPCDNSPSMDRIVPEKGYTKENIKIISFKANTIKSFGTAEEHRKIAEYIEKNEALNGDK
ncbi:MAG: hypothetical protein HC875_20720 [Anaerolineales bacterium]|nr:hypothetical protein [Anaerolineales bacterium]